MGLPIWNYSDEREPEKPAKEPNKIDPTAATRSNIRRRHASVLGRHGGLSADALRNARRLWESNLPSDVLPPVPEPVSSSRTSDVQNTIHMRDGILTIGRDGPHFAARQHRHNPHVHQHRQQQQQPQQDGTSAEPARPHRRVRLAPQQPVVSSTAHARSLRRGDADDTHVLPLFDRSRPQSRNGATPRTNLPTPPLDTSVLPTPDEILQRHYIDSPNPITFTTRDLSPDNGLGDRRRSVSPGADVWQIMRSTITPDETLPSTSSSFTTAAAAEASFTQPEQGHQAASPDESGQPQIDGRDVTFEDTMREMGIEVSSSSAPSSVDSSPESDDESMASDHDSSFESDNDSECEPEHVRQSERRRVALRLYDIAMQTYEGRQQIAALYDPEGMENGDFTYLEFLLGQTPSTASISDDRGSENSSLPFPEPEQFSAEVHDRAQEATSRTHAFFTEPSADGSSYTRWREARRERRRERGARHNHNHNHTHSAPSSWRSRSSATRDSPAHIGAASREATRHARDVHALAG